MAQVTRPVRRAEPSTSRIRGKGKKMAKISKASKLVEF